MDILQSALHEGKLRLEAHVFISDDLSDKLIVAALEVKRDHLDVFILRRLDDLESAQSIVHYREDCGVPTHSYASKH